MIIIVSNDELTLKGARVIKHQQPLESGHRFPDSLVDSKGKLRVESDGKIPSRITFLGHSGWKTYGGKNPNNFADDVIEMLKNAAEADPSIKSSLTHIDLIGCHNGFVDDQGNSFTITVAHRLLELQKEGFKEIRVSAFTNNMLADPHPFYKLETWVNFKDNTFVTRGFRTKKEHKAYEYLHEKADEIEEKQIAPLEEELLKIRAEKSDLKEKYSENNEGLTKLKLKYNSLKERRARREARIERLTEDSEVIEEKKVEYKSNIAKELLEIKSLQTELAKSKQDLVKHQRILRSINDQIKVEILEISDSLAELQDDAHQRKSAWVSQIDVCVNRVQSIKDNKHLTTGEQAKQIKQELETTVQTIRSSFWGSKGSFFFPGSTIATALENTLLSQLTAIDRLSSLEARSDGLNKKTVSCTSHLEQSGKIIEKNKNELDKARSEMKKIAQESRSRTREIAEINKHLEKIKAEAKELQSQAPQLKEEFKPLSEKEQEINKKIETLSEQANELRKRANDNKTIIAVTHDIRATLNSPQCDFTALAKEKLAQESEQKLTI